MRLFVALPVPEDAREALAALRADLPGARWTPAGGLHLTLCFIGEAADDAALAIRALLADVRSARPTIRLVARDAFPSGRRPNVLVARAEPDPALAALHRQVESALAAVGVRPEGRPHRPHVTLARLRSPEPGAVRAWLCGAPPDLAFEPEALVLFESRLDPTGAFHTPLATYPLG